MNKPQYSGEQLGIDLIPRKSDESDNHILIKISSEDDDFWHEKLIFSCCYIDELIQQLQKAKAFIETQEPDFYNGHRYGWQFKDKK